MRIGISGSSGFVGSFLFEHFKDHNPVAIKCDGENWILPEEPFDVVIHLAGANIAKKRWSKAYKQEIYNSRIHGTRALAESIQTKTFICASAVGYYGNRGDEELNESSPRGTGFLADVAATWEQTAYLAKARVCTPRFGMVLGNGGALNRMLPLFKWYLGGHLGDGKQWMSWIHLEDLARGIQHLIENESLEGPFNFCAEPVRNLEFSKTLARILKRPCTLPAPAPLIKLLLGEMGESLLLSSTCTTNKKLLESGFTFLYPTLDQALSKILCI